MNKTNQQNKQSKKCEHKKFNANVAVNRLEDSKRFIADVKIDCLECGEPFKFLGLPMGLNLNGVAVDPTWTEASLAIAPLSENDKSRYKIMMGFSIKNHE